MPLAIITGYYGLASKSNQDLCLYRELLATIAKMGLTMPLAISQRNQATCLYRELFHREKAQSIRIDRCVGCELPTRIQQ